MTRSTALRTYQYDRRTFPARVFVGSQPNLEIRWAISEHFLAALNVAGFVTGEFLKQSPPSNAIAFFNLGLTYRF